MQEKLLNLKFHIVEVMSCLDSAMSLVKSVSKKFIFQIVERLKPSALAQFKHQIHYFQK